MCVPGRQHKQQADVSLTNRIIGSLITNLSENIDRTCFSVEVKCKRRWRQEWDSDTSEVLKLLTHAAAKALMSVLKEIANKRRARGRQKGSTQPVLIAIIF